jgi:phage gpG-like protein
MNIEITGNIDDGVTELLSIKKIGINSKNILNITAKELRNDVEKNFLGEHDPEGNRWAELTDYTKKRKKNRQEILQDTGALIEEMTSLENYLVSNNTLDVVTRVQGEVEPGDDPFYGVNHNEGIGITQRQFVAYTEKIHNEIDKKVKGLFD